MKIKPLLVIALTVLIVSGCASVKVRTDYDPEFDFKGLKTYRWATDKELNPGDLLAKSPLIRNRIIESVDSVMAEKGFTKKISGEADLVIVMHAGVKEKIRVDHTHTGPHPAYYGGRYYRGWYDPWWGAYGGYTTVSNYTEGTLVIDLVCWRTKELAWRGLGSQTIREYKNPEKQQAAIDRAVAKILAGFPPK